MEMQDEKIFMEQALKKLLDRGWVSGNELVHSQITDREIGDSEDKYQIKLPAYYNAFRSDEIAPLWLLLYGIDNFTNHVAAGFGAVS